MRKKIEKILEDKLGRDIVTFFYQNQSSIDTVSGIAAWVHSDKNKVKEALDRLVQLGILEEDSMGGTKGYCYTRKTKIMKIIKELMKDNE
jgi:predicted transcriptional regulator with HTH domain